MGWPSNCVGNATYISLDILRIETVAFIYTEIPKRKHRTEICKSRSETTRGKINEVAHSKHGFFFREEGTHLHLVEAMKISRLREKTMLKLLKMTTLAGLLAITSTVRADAVTGSFTNGDKANVKNIKSSIKDRDAHIAMLKDGSTGAVVTVNCAALKDADLVQGATYEMSVECQDPIIIETPAGTGMANIPENLLEAWQLGLINNPDDYMLKREAKGFVFIYDRLLDSQIDEILDNHFNRIDSMMFTRVKVTDSKGDIQIDPETGEELTEDDGCD